LKIKGIRYTAPVFDSSGYAKASRGNILALHSAGIPIKINPISFDKDHPDLGEDGKILRSLVDNDVECNINLMHSTPEFWEKHKSSTMTNVGYTIWETTKLHPAWPSYINNNVTKVLVGCEWNVQIFRDSGVEIPIGVVPHGINADKFNDIEPYQIAGIPEDTFVFYSIFQWSERKLPIALLKAYYHAFNEKHNVALVLKTYLNMGNPQDKQTIIEMIQRIKSTMLLDSYPKVILVSDLLSEDEIIGLHARGNCYVSLDRGEGFGLGPFEAGASGNPIIVTGFGGVTEYAKEDNSSLVDYQLTPVFGMGGNPWYRGDQLWAEPDVLCGANSMSWAYHNQEAIADEGLQLQEDIRKNFSWEVIANKIIKEIEEI